MGKMYEKGNKEKLKLRFSVQDENDRFRKKAD